MKRIATIANFCNGKRLRGVANPLISKRPRVQSAPANNKPTAALREGEAIAGMGKARPEIYDHLEPARNTGAFLDSNAVDSRELNEC